MKKCYYLFGALAITVMVGCSSDEVVQQQTPESLQTKHAITISPTSVGATRSQVFNSTSDMTSFMVIALADNAVKTGDKFWIAGTEYTVEENVNDGPYSPYRKEFGPDGKQEVVYSNKGWNFRDGKTRYWPYKQLKTGEQITGYECLPMTFRAYTPTNLNTAYEDAARFLMTGAITGEFVYNGGATTPNAPVPVSKMQDICFAAKSGATSADGAVKLEFKHAFSQIVFAAKKTSNYEVDIKAIEIGGMKYAGCMYFSKFDSGEKWGGNMATNLTYYPGFASLTPISLTSAADEKPVQLTEAGQELILMPQEVLAWDPVTVGAVKTAATPTTPATPVGGYVSVTFRYRLAGTSEWITGGGAADGYETTYFPLKALWKSGKKYVYTLLFGGATNGTNTDPQDNPDPGSGYEADGTPKAPSVAITFTPTVTDWVTSNVNINQ